MKNKLGTEERKFAHIIWREENLTTRKLIELAEKELGWKKSTSYTVLKHLSEKGFFMNDNGNIRILVSKDEYYSRESSAYVQEAFSGSLPAFVTAFISSCDLTQDDIDELNRLINEKEKQMKADPE